MEGTRERAKGIVPGIPNELLMIRNFHTGLSCP